MFTEFLANLTANLKSAAESADSSAGMTDDHIEKLCSRFQEETLRCVKEAIEEAVEQTIKQMAEPPAKKEKNAG